MLYFQTDELNPGGAVLSVFFTSAGTTLEIAAEGKTLRFTMAPNVVQTLVHVLEKAVE